jgi:TetR/AcrR family transcriptional regulator
VSITTGHVSRLQALVDEVEAEPGARARLRELIRRIVEEYADAQDAHRVLTEDVKFLDEADRERVLDQERDVVNGFARAVSEARRAAAGRAQQALTMLLFGMINWMFTWMKPQGELDYDAMAPIGGSLHGRLDGRQVARPAVGPVAA